MQSADPSIVLSTIKLLNPNITLLSPPVAPLVPYNPVWHVSGLLNPVAYYVNSMVDGVGADVPVLYNPALVVEEVPGVDSDGYNTEVGDGGLEGSGTHGLHKGVPLGAGRDTNLLLVPAGVVLVLVGV